MAWNFSYSPYAAISGASRAIGAAQFQREEEERHRKRALEDRQLALESQRLIDEHSDRSFKQGLAVENFNENRRRFDVGQQNDLYGQRMDRASRQAQLAAQLQARREGDLSDLMGRQMSADSERVQRQDALQAGLLERQMMGQQGLAEADAVTQRQLQTGALTGDYQLRNKLATAQVDPLIAQGLQDGSLRYSARQKAEMQKLQDSINEARRDPRLTPAERMQFEAQQLQAYNTVRDNPQQVPPDERPKSMQQMFEEETTPITDPVTGQTTRWQRVVRAGAAQWVPVEQPKDPQHEMQLKEREFQINQQHEDSAREQKNREYDLKLRDQHNEFLVKQLEREWNSEMTALDSEMPNRSSPEFTTPVPATETSPASEKFDQSGFSAAMTAHRAKVAKANEEFRNRRTMLPLAPSNLTAPLEANMPPLPGSAPPLEMGPPVNGQAPQEMPMDIPVAQPPQEQQSQSGYDWSPWQQLGVTIADDGLPVMPEDQQLAAKLIQSLRPNDRIHLPDGRWFIKH